MLPALLIPAAGWATPGDLDQSFGQDGHAAVQTNRACLLHGCVEFAGSYADALALQPDGGIVLGGYINLGPAPVVPGASGALVRLLPNGTLDSSFGGSGGIVETPFAVSEIHANARGGLKVTGQLGDRLGVQRYTSDGVLDGLYGTQGVRWLPRIGEGQRDSAGRILEFVTFIVPATEYKEAVVKLGVTRLLPTGGRDRSFGHNGYVSLPEGTKPVALTLQRAGSVLVAFATERQEGVPSRPSHLFLERLTSTGKLDRAFDKGGVVRVPLVGGLAGGATIVARPHGHMFIVGGERRGKDSFGDFNLFLAAYDLAGHLDHHFGKDGVTRSRVSNGSSYTTGVSPLAIAFDGSENMIVTGKLDAHTIDTPAGDGFLVRYTPQGRDCSFSGGGVIVDKRFGAMNSIALQPDGRIVVAGWGGGFLAARYIGGAAHTCAGEPTR